jgi:hypothetical protein
MTGPHSLDVPEVITVGRVSVDLYAQEVDAAFTDPQTFRKSVGGSPTNVAVAAARYGHRTAVVTKVGADALGDYVIARLAEWGVDTRYIGRDAGALTPVVLAALAPPEEPQIIFYRGEAAPDTTITTSEVPHSDIADCRVFWMSQGALAQGATAESSFTWLEARGRSEGRDTVLDLDYRPSMWPMWRQLVLPRSGPSRTVPSWSAIAPNARWRWESMILMRSPTDCCLRACALRSSNSGAGEFSWLMRRDDSVSILSISMSCAALAPAMPSAVPWCTVCSAAGIWN